MSLDRSLYRTSDTVAGGTITTQAPSRLLPYLIGLLHANDVEDAYDVLAFCPDADRPRLLPFVYGRSSFPWHSVHAIVRTCTETEVRQAVGRVRAETLRLQFGDPCLV